MTAMLADSFVIRREFDAPRGLVWKVHSDCAHLKHWWGPKGSVMAFCKIDFRPGGAFQYCLKMPDGQEVWSKFTYREIVAPERFVCVVSFCDKDARVVRCPFIPDWPLEVLSTTSFAEAKGKTTVTIRWAPLNASKTECQAFEQTHDSMNQGFSGTFDQLAEYLARV